MTAYNSYLKSVQTSAFLSGVEQKPLRSVEVSEREFNVSNEEKAMHIISNAEEFYALECKHCWLETTCVVHRNLSSSCAPS